MAWTDTAREAAKALWTEGLSASQIAKRVNKDHGASVTRNAVIGLIHRAGLSGRATPAKPAKPHRTVFKAPRPTSPIIAMSPGVAPAVSAHRIAESPRVRYVDEGPGLATIHTLSAHMCKWPIGSPGEDDFTHCGERADGGPYCPRHAAIAYQPAQAKKKSSADELYRSVRRYV